MAEFSVLDRIMNQADAFRDGAAATEKLGRLPDEAAARMRENGVIRMLQPSDHGGLQTHPREFFESVMGLASHCGSSGWVSGIVGVHPWELAIFETKLQDEIWGEDPDTWIASPYAPMGRARPVEGGWILDGRWQFSSGTDHCTWIFLGGLETEPNGDLGKAPRNMHFVLPRSDYEIIEDSWDVVGLKGTGSKDIVVRSAFVPSYRAVAFDDVVDGSAARASGRTDPLYLMPWAAIFPNAISSAVIGICEGGIEAAIEFQRGRPNVPGEALLAIGQASSDIRAARLQLLDNVDRMFDLVESGREIPLEFRFQARSDQVRCSWRAVRALDEAFTRSGGNSIRLGQPVQRFWRDAHAGLNHMINVPSAVHRNHVLTQLGTPVSGAFV